MSTKASLKSPASRLFSQPCVQAQNKENLIESKLVNTNCFPITERITDSNTNYALEPHGTLKYKRNNR